MADTLFTYGPSNVTTLLTTTIENRRGEIQDNIFNQMVVVKYLKDKNKVNVDGGASIVQPVMYAANTTAGFFSDYDLLDISPQEGFTAAQYQWKEAYASISVSNREETIQNVGKHQVFSIVKAKMDQAEESLRNAINGGFFTAAPTSKQMTSLVTLIDTTSSIGQINSTTSTWWAATSTASGSFGAQGRSDMLTTYNTVVYKGGRPDLIVTTPAVHGFYEGSQVSQIRYQNSSMANASFETLKFKTADIVFDNACTSGVMYFLDTNHIELLVNSGNDFKLTEFVKPANQTAKTAQLVVALELTTNNRRRLAKMTSITA